MHGDSMFIAVIVSVIVGDVIWLWKCFLIFLKDILIVWNSIMVVDFVFKYLMSHSFLLLLVIIVLMVLSGVHEID